MARTATPGSPLGLLGHLEQHAVPAEEVRFAVVLNGGVSLAVWMGGVVLELDRLTKADAAGVTPYSLLKRLTGCSARADVITGTSAGGINGAALALTQINRDRDPAMLRDLWIEQGRLESLLRQPFQGQPTSLLRGDEYFLPRLHAALELLATPGEAGIPWDPRRAPIDLSITTTVLRPNQAVTVDSTGQRLPQSLHAARFHWRRLPGVEAEQDPFSTQHLARTAHRLALAARSSASFPVAFEPSFVPVGSPGHREPAQGAVLDEEVRLRPDMAGVVESWGTGSADRDRSRFCVDGGVLANTPTLAALEACEAMPAGGPVRRVMLLVYPHAPEPGVDPPDDLDAPPTVVGAISGLLGALTAEGGRTHVEAMQRHNLAAAGRRGARGDILRQIDEPDGLDSLVTAIYPQYRRLRRWRAGRDLAAQLTGTGEDHDFPVADLAPEWGFERVRSAAESAQDAWEITAPAAGREPLPYAPSATPAPDNVDAPGWGWGVTAALGVTEAVSDLLRRAVWVLPPGPQFRTVEQARESVLRLAERIREARDLTDACWRSEPALTRLAPDQSYWTLRLACYDYLMCGRVTLDEIGECITRVSGDEGVRDAVTAALADTLKTDLAPGHAGRAVSRLVAAAIRLVRPALVVLGGEDHEIANMDPDLPHWRRVIFPGPSPEDLPDTFLLAQLLRLEIASTTLGDEVSTGATLPVELVQISAQTQNPFATNSRTAADKLGGDALNRFGGFLKRSWRVNDWIWGRADGATILSRTMLDPRRIRRAARLSGYVTEATSPLQARELAVATTAEIIAGLGVAAEAGDVEELVVDDLARVFDLAVPEGDLPSAMGGLSSLFAWAQHLASVPAELPALAQAIAADRVDGANPRSRGELLMAEQAELLRRLDSARLDPDGITSIDRRQALAAFDRAGIGREPLREEASSDLVIRTAASAAAVASTVADSSGSGLGAVRPVTRALRGAMLLPYWAIWGLSSRQTIARGLSLLAMALGGTALALALFGVLSPNLQPLAAALGAGALLAAFAYGALRTGSLLHSIVLLTPVIPLMVYSQTVGTQDARGVSTVVVVAALALGLIALGSIGVATGSVWAALDLLGDRRGLVRPRRPGARRPGRALYTLKVWLRRVVAVGATLAMLLGIAAVGLVVAGLVWWLVDESRIDFVQHNHRWLWLPALAVIALGGLVANLESRWFAVLTNRPSDEGPSWDYAPVVEPRATGAGWSVVYGTIYLVIAWVVSLEVLGDANPLWRRVAFATAITFALVLLVVLPVTLPLIALRDIVGREVARADSWTPPVGADPATRLRAFAADLAARGTSYRRFVTADGQRLRLTDPGERLEQRVCDARAANDLLSAWNAPAICQPGDVSRLKGIDGSSGVLRAWEESSGSHLSPGGRRRLDDLSALLRTEQADPAQVRHAVDRLVATLRRG